MQLNQFITEEWLKQGCSLAFLFRKISKFFFENVDILIEPAVGNISWTDFFKYRELIRIGEKAAELKLEEIKKTLKPKLSETVLRWPKRIFSAKSKRAAAFKQSDIRWLITTST